VIDTEKFDLLQRHQQRCQNTVLSAENTALLESISADHLASERVFNVHDNFTFRERGEAAWVDLFKAVKESAVGLEDQDFVFDLSWNGHTHVADVLTLVKEQAMGTEISKQVCI